MESGEWDSIVIDGVRCLPVDGLSLLRQALDELGCRADQWAGGKASAMLGSDTDDEEEEKMEMELASNAVDLEVLVQGDEEESRSSIHEALLAERLAVPGSCWDGKRGPQVFFADPPVHLDPGDPTRHLEYDAGRLGFWDFKSELVALRAGVCFPLGSLPAQATVANGSCRVVFSHSNQVASTDTGEMVCTAPFGWESETRVLAREARGASADARQGVLFSECSTILLRDYSPDSFWFALNFTCSPEVTWAQGAGIHY
jgi:hypothetical protein